MFNGCNSERRVAILAALEKEGVKIAPNPMPEALTAGFKSEIISQTKLCINVHFSPMEYFEKPRLMYDFFMNKAVVLSEKVLYPEIFESTQDLFMIKYQNIVPVVLLLLNKYNKDMLSIGEEAYTKFKNNYYYTKVISNFLKDLQSKELGC